MKKKSVMADSMCSCRM